MDAIRGADEVVAEFYTSHLVGCTMADLESALGRPVEVLPREHVEEAAADLVERARNQRLAFLTAGDPLTATTHQTLRVQAVKSGVPVEVIHGVSIYSAAPAAAGLQAYKFGRTTTLVFPEPRYNPTSPYDLVRDNWTRGLHTLVLLDLRAHEDKYMRVAQGVAQLVEIDARQKDPVFDGSTRFVGLARVGAADQCIAWGTAKELGNVDFGGPLHTVIVPGRLHDEEVAVLELFAAGTRATKNA